MQRPLKKGDVCYIRVRVVEKMSEPGFGEWAVEPITKWLSQVRPGLWIYVNRDELITQQEAREAVK